MWDSGSWLRWSTKRISRASPFPPPDTVQTGRSAKGRRTSEHRRAACMPCTLCARARTRTHALLARARTPSAREGRSPLPPCAGPTPILTVRKRFTGRPFHVSSDALIGLLATKAFACVHKWVGAASASTSLPLCPRLCLWRWAPRCHGAGPSRRTLRWLVVAPPHISWLPRVACSNALCMLPAPTHTNTCLRFGAGTDAVLIVHLFFKPEALESEDADVRLRLRHRRRLRGRLSRRHPRRRRLPLRHPRRRHRPNEFMQGAMHRRHAAAGHLYATPHAAAAAAAAAAA